MHVIAMASPRATCTVVDDVGTILPGPASLTDGNKNFKSEFLYNSESFLKLCQLVLYFCFRCILNNIF